MSRLEAASGRADRLRCSFADTFASCSSSSKVRLVRAEVGKFFEPDRDAAGPLFARGGQGQFSRSGAEVP